MPARCGRPKDSLYTVEDEKTWWPLKSQIEMYQSTLMDYIQISDAYKYPIRSTPACDDSSNLNTNNKLNNTVSISKKWWRYLLAFKVTNKEFDY